MEQLTMKLETILEVVRVKQEVMERPVEYRTGMISSSYAGNFGIKEIGDEASEVVLVVVLNMKNEIELIARYVADTSPFDNLKITDEFDNLILSTIGFYLD